MVLRVGSFDVDDLLLNLVGVWSGLLLLGITSILREA
jgi:glycopeptide antibiotics resistance protein